ncbi:hypothetical protein [Haloarcula halobia]|uniref:hypothetical protein n=1 Tax=Haloarcula halobia TaxID=3033388 RepID=UPI0023EB2A2C|nr:hypothetical protein [Halomicroarcula sp. XH51]
MTVVALLLLSAGCSALSSTADTGPNATPVPSTETATVTSTEDDCRCGLNNFTTTTTATADGKDLRSVELGQIAGGEIDSKDPVGDQGFYEPVKMEGDRGQKVTVLMQAAQGDPRLKVVAPNGSVIASDDNNGPDESAEIEDLVLPEDGEYTIKSMSAEPNSTFQYALDVSDYDDATGGWYDGDATKWNRSEQLGEFTIDYQELADDEDVHMTPADEVDAVNPEKEYIVVTYRLESDSPSSDKLTAIDASLLVTYDLIVEDYVGSDADVNESWVPDRVYHRAVTPDGELYRTTYVSKTMVDRYTGDNYPEYWFAYLSTGKFGPANPNYIEGAENSTTELDYPEMDEDTEKYPP